MRARHRLSKLLLRNGILYWDGNAWTSAHEQWLRQQHFDEPGQQIAYTEAFDTVLAVTSRRDRLDQAIIQMARQARWQDPVSRLSCIRGISTLTAFGLTVEVADWHRFTGATIGAYLGLVPTENSSGEKQVRGSITKAGNTHARRLLVESAWHHRKPLRVAGGRVRAQRETVSPAVRARAREADRRLHQRWLALDLRTKKSTVSAVAVARELASWCWSIATLDD